MTRRRRVNLTKTCRVVACGRTTGRTRLCTPCTGHVEQRLAFGDLPHEAARRIGTTVGDVIRVGEHMDAAARSGDDPRNDGPDPTRSAPQKQKCQRGHLFSTDNILRRNDDRIECRTCKQDRDRRYNADMRVRRAAS